MGCGGSRADALEPRYLESWTRDTESTWLTGSDTDAGPDAGALEDGPSPSGVPRATVTSGISNLEKKMNCGIQSLSSGPLAQKQNGLWGTQAKRDAKWMSAKEVTISVPDSLRKVDRSNRVTKNCTN
ncbi:brain and acute leukemia cytoplasmic protein isoform X7 [Heterocephalus glaber]|uniref:Brain and acute leukemia cytoplasmic protein isoform X7 n=1 Tax=Heterocephalus glaber TaxID=10181 RepID=A0AAX6PFX4_HETGA|nr:brain and acute leukemia cytoplasmic protein isoform X7 [Heterocephalus glaber]